MNQPQLCYLCNRPLDPDYSTPTENMRGETVLVCDRCVEVKVTRHRRQPTEKKETPTE